MVRTGVSFVVAVLALTLAIVVVDRLTAPGPDVGVVPLGGAPYAPVRASAPLQQRAQPPVAGDNPLPVVDATWLTRTAVEAGIPETALGAYARATLRSPRDCGLGWTTLAAIGWVESRHGTIGDRVLGLDGTSSTPIVGPALDGGSGFGAIEASRAGTARHGDARWDHAVGPMQFITSTWHSWGADGDGDGVADPHDIDDASWTAARYLCADDGDLTSGSGWSRAISSYNHSQAYLDGIHAAATSYAARARG